MLSQSTDTVLRAMKLTGMANELERQNADPKLIASLSFEERISLIVDAEWRKRQSSKMKRYVNDACLPIKRAQVEDIEYHPDRKLKKAQIIQLASCNYKTQGLAFVMLIEALICRDFQEAMKDANVKGKSIRDCLLDARLLKIHKRKDSWQICNCKKSVLTLFELLHTPLAVDAAHT